jgi:predicted nucleic acid-binding protein
MITSSKPEERRGLDSVILIYSLLRGHPASEACEEFIKCRTGWVSSTLVLLEVKSVITKVYGGDPAIVEAELVRLASGPVSFEPIDTNAALAAMRRVEALGIDSTDAALLEVCAAHGAKSLATEDRKLARVAVNLGIVIESPIDETVREAVSLWEGQGLPLRGLSRILHRTHAWLRERDAALSEEFWSVTGAGTHLP